MAIIIIMRTRHAQTWVQMDEFVVETHTSRVEAQNGDLLGGITGSVSDFPFMNITLSCR